MADEQLEGVVGALMDAIGDAGEAGTSARGILPDNLLSITDSFGFVQLLAAIEDRLGIELDIGGVELGDLVNSASLVSFIQDQIRARQGLSR